jgi:hypothetical protein
MQEPKLAQRRMRVGDQRQNLVEAARRNVGTEFSWAMPALSAKLEPFQKENAKGQAAIRQEESLIAVIVVIRRRT